MVNPKKIRTAGRALFKVFKKYKWRFIAISILGFLSGLSAAVGIGAIIPVFSILIGQGIPEINSITELIKNIFSLFNIPLRLPFLLLFIISLFVAKGVLRFLALYINEKTFTLYEKEMRDDLFGKTLATNWPYLLNHNIGHLEKTLMRDLTVSTSIIRQITDVILWGTSLIMYVFVAFSISPHITLITAGFGVALSLVFNPTLSRIKIFAQKLESIEKQIAHFINESMIGSRAIKTYAAEVPVATRGHRLFEDLRTNKLKTLLYKHAVGSAYEPIGFMFIVVLFIIYYQLPGFEIASFAAIVYLIQKIFGFAQLIQLNAQTVSEQLPYVEALYRYRQDIIANQEETGGSRNFQFNRALEFAGVSFGYTKDQPILMDIRFTVEKNVSVGLVGPSGAGKTTVVDLVMRLLKPQKGEITLDGSPVEDFDLASWRKKIGYVSQDLFLVNDTIAENIRFFDDSIADEDVKCAAEKAHIYEVIEGMPQGFETKVGERGIKLSVGQRQRIALARVLVRNPQILILDEATSALDNESEQAIQQTMKELKGTITIITIAHRLSTIMDSDKLIILDSGKIVEEGSPKELLKKQDSHFYRIYHAKDISWIENK